MKVCNSFALTAVAVSLTLASSSVRALYLDSLNNGKTVHSPMGYVETPVELGHIQETLQQQQLLEQQKQQAAEEPLVMYENGLDPAMEQVVNLNLAAAAVQGLQHQHQHQHAVDAVPEHPDFPEAKIRDEYAWWCAKFQKPMDDARYPTFRENWIRQEEYGRATGQYFWLNEFGDCTQDEYMEIMQMQQQIRNDPHQQMRVEAAAEAAAPTDTLPAPAFVPDQPAPEPNADPMAAYAAAIAAASQSLTPAFVNNNAAAVETPMSVEEDTLVVGNANGATDIDMDIDIDDVDIPDLSTIAQLEQEAEPDASLAIKLDDTFAVQPSDNKYSYPQYQDSKLVESAKQAARTNYLDNLTPHQAVSTPGAGITSYLDNLQPNEIVTSTHTRKGPAASYMDSLSAPTDDYETPEMTFEDTSKYETALEDKYASIDCREERAYQVLLDLGMVSATAGGAKKESVPEMKIEQPLVETVVDIPDAESDRATPVADHHVNDPVAEPTEIESPVNGKSVDDLVVDRAIEEPVAVVVVEEKVHAFAVEENVAAIAVKENVAAVAVEEPVHAFAFKETVSDSFAEPATELSVEEPAVDTSIDELFAELALEETAEADLEIPAGAEELESDAQAGFKNDMQVDLSIDDTLEETVDEVLEVDEPEIMEEHHTVEEVEVTEEPQNAAVELDEDVVQVDDEEVAAEAEVVSLVKKEDTHAKKYSFIDNLRERAFKILKDLRSVKKD